MIDALSLVLQLSIDRITEINSILRHKPKPCGRCRLISVIDIVTINPLVKIALIIVWCLLLSGCSRKESPTKYSKSPDRDLLQPNNRSRSSGIHLLGDFEHLALYFGENPL